MTRTNQSEHLRYRYGMCLNDACSKAKSKEVQQISARKEFVCGECGKPLRECPPPSTGNGKKIALIVAIVVVLLGGGYGLYVTLGSEETQPVSVQPEQVMPEVPEDTVTAVPAVEEAVETPAQEPESKPVTPQVMNGRGTVDLGYGTYTGDLKNGKPHGYGVITYKASHKIVSSKDFMAQPGDTFEGEFREGRISGLGYWKHDGNETAVKP